LHIFGPVSVHTLVDLFAGCGGLTLGFEKTGRFRSVLAVEADPDAAATYEQNFDAEVNVSRIEAVEQFPHADIVVGGPPCQPFSLLNRRQVGPERRTLWRQYLRALSDTGCRTFLMENVPELLRSLEYREFTEHASALGFRVEGRILNAADFGVPQTRRRAIVLGTRLGEPLWPAETHGDPDKLELERHPWRTLREAVADLPLVPDGLNWHRSRSPRPQSIERYRAVPANGGTRFDMQRALDEQGRGDLVPRCWREKTSGTTDVFGRLWWDRPACTIRTEFYKPEKGRYLHPTEDRPITVREAARCMSFPDDFVFPEDQSMTSVGRQIGNAVPPTLAFALACALDLALEEGADERAHLQAA
jgi:DNA (cytosine-5)-methyltransferase 1